MKRFLTIVLLIITTVIISAKEGNGRLFVVFLTPTDSIMTKAVPILENYKIMPVFTTLKAPATDEAWLAYAIKKRYVFLEFEDTYYAQWVMFDTKASTTLVYGNKMIIVLYATTGFDIDMATRTLNFSAKHNIEVWFFIYNITDEMKAYGEITAYGGLIPISTFSQVIETAKTLNIEINKF